MNSIHPDVSRFLLDDSEIIVVDKSFNRKETVREIRELATRSLLDVVVPYYSKFGFQVNTCVYNFLVEPLKNSNFYGSDGIDKILFELYLSRNGLVASYNDGGSYFRREDVKDCWEKRMLHLEKHPSVNEELGFGMGTDFIYTMADFIFIDTLHGSLNIGLSISNEVFRK